MATYGQFCPVAKASEIIAERWTPLIIRELLLGCTRFSELEWGLPGIPRSLLASRLRLLESAGIVVRTTSGSERKTAYHLTQAGRELQDLIFSLGEWGQRWANDDIDPGQVQPSLLMWDMRRRINTGRLPDRRVVVEVQFEGLRTGTYWLVLSRHDEIAVCRKHPGFEVDLRVRADAMALHQVWLGRLLLSDALARRLVVVEGPPDLAKAFPGWLAFSLFADIAPATAAVHA
jgi:DNA-binding HxlR family transcriptional regulator